MIFLWMENGFHLIQLMFEKSFSKYYFTSHVNKCNIVKFVTILPLFSNFPQSQVFVWIIDFHIFYIKMLCKINNRGPKCSILQFTIIFTFIYNSTIFFMANFPNNSKIPTTLAHKHWNIHIIKISIWNYLKHFLLSDVLEFCRKMSSDIKYCWIIWILETFLSLFFLNFIVILYPTALHKYLFNHFIYHQEIRKRNLMLIWVYLSYS